MRNYIFPAEFTPVFDYTFTDSDGGEPRVWMRVQTCRVAMTRRGVDSVEEKSGEGEGEGVRMYV